MKRYFVKCRSGKIEFFDVMEKRADGYRVRLTSISEGNEKTTDEFMSYSLFDMCLKTGYIYEMEAVDAAA
jgi:hypothetical protein